MARILTCGFEQQGAGEMTSQNHLFSTSTVRPGGGIVSAQFSNTGYFFYQERATGQRFDELYVRFAVYIPSLASAIRPNIASGGSTILGLAYGGGTAISVQYWNGSAWVTIATSNTNVPISTWHLIEWHFKLHPAGGVSEIRQNGVPTSVYRGPTMLGPQGFLEPTRFYWIAGGSATAHYYDDIAINDVAGAYQNSWCGDGYVLRLAPNGNGSASQMTGSDGDQTNNYLLVDEKPYNSDTDYVQDWRDDYTDLYTLEDLGSLGSNEVKLVQVSGVTKYSGSYCESHDVDLVAKSGSSEGVTTQAPSSYNTYARLASNPLYLDPDTGLPWTESAVNALEAGVRLNG